MKNAVSIIDSQKRDQAVMFIIVLGIAVIVSAMLERSISIEKSNHSNILIISRILIGILVFLISYFVTDTPLDLLYVFLVFCLPIFSLRVMHSDYNEKLKYFVYLFMWPLIAYLFIRASQSSLIEFNFIIILIIVLRMIYAFPQRSDNPVKHKIALGIGAFIALSIIFFYFNPYDENKEILRKQEIVGRNFLEEELGLCEFEIYIIPDYTNIRGKETIVRAFDSSGSDIKMVYKNSRIISHEIE